MYVYTCVYIYIYVCILYIYMYIYNTYSYTQSYMYCMHLLNHILKTFVSSIPDWPGLSPTERFLVHSTVHCAAPWIEPRPKTQSGGHITVEQKSRPFSSGRVYNTQTSKTRFTIVSHSTLLAESKSTNMVQKNRCGFPRW